MNPLSLKTNLARLMEIIKVNLKKFKKLLPKYLVVDDEIYFIPNNKVFLEAYKIILEKNNKLNLFLRYLHTSLEELKEVALNENKVGMNEIEYRFLLHLFKTNNFVTRKYKKSDLFPVKKELISGIALIVLQEFYREML